MEDSEIKEWADLLVDPKLSTTDILQDLLDNSKGDEMSRSDKATCIRALQLIKQGVIHDRPAKSLDRSLRSGFLVSDGQDGPEQVEIERVVD